MSFEVLSIVCRIDLKHPIDLRRFALDHSEENVSMSELDQTCRYEHDRVMYVIYATGVVVMVGPKELGVFSKASTFIQGKMAQYAAGSSCSRN